MPDPRDSQSSLPMAGREPVGPIPVRRFGKYYLVKKLAEGGMAEIFLAKQVGMEGFEKNIVLKRMLANLSTVPDFVAMFLDEARVASRLSHPNVVQIHDLGFEEGCYFIAMEYLAGEDFSHIIRTHARARTYVPIDVVLKVVAEAAHGLQYAHTFSDAKGVPMHIVHRDVSPSNIFVTYTGQVKMLDFGIAKAESRLTNTTAGVVKGKYQYMAPEQANAGLVDNRADVYSLGVCLYEALTNYRPFARDTDLAILNAVLKNEYRRPLDARPDLPPELERIIAKALSPQPQTRYQNAAELAADLEAYLSAMGVAASGAALGQFMQQYFGPERVASRTRIETLTELKASGAVVTSPGPAALGPEGRTPSVIRRASRRRLAVGLVAGLAAVVGGTFFATRAFDHQLEVDAGAAIAPVVPDAAVAVLAPPVADAAVEVELPDAAVVAAQEPDAGKPAATRPVVLTMPMITGVVRRGTGSIAKCFEQNRADLPSTDGQIAVTFTIASSGRVSKADSAMPGKAVGRCLEDRVKQLRFPAHVDKEVTVTLPFAYQVAH